MNLKEPCVNDGKSALGSLQKKIDWKFLTRQYNWEI